MIAVYHVNAPIVYLEIPNCSREPVFVIHLQPTVPVIERVLDGVPYVGA
jgi:hypothetical protein